MRLIFENGGQSGMQSLEAVPGGLEMWQEGFGPLYVEHEGERHQLLSQSEMAEHSKAMGNARWREMFPPMVGDTATVMAEKLGAELWARGEAWVIASSLGVAGSVAGKKAL